MSTSRAAFSNRSEVRSPCPSDIGVSERLGNALHRLTRALDEVLSSQDTPGRDALRTLRLVSTDALHALLASANEANGRRGNDPFEAGLRAMAAEFAEVTGSVAHVRVTGEVEGLSSEVAGALRDVAVEALWNVDRHARASVLLLSLAVEDAMVRFDIVDDGVDVARRQVAAWGSSVDLGLRRMRRAVEALGGRLAVHSLQPRGLRLSVVVPRANASVR